MRCFDPSLSSAVQSFYVDTMEEDGRRVEQLFRNAETLGIPVEVRPCCFPLSSFVSYSHPVPPNSAAVCDA